MKAISNNYSVLTATSYRLRCGGPHTEPGGRPSHYHRTTDYAPIIGLTFEANTHGSSVRLIRNVESRSIAGYGIFLCVQVRFFKNFMYIHWVSRLSRKTGGCCLIY